VSGTRRVARVITRLNIGGPSIQAIDLSRELVPRGFDTCLIHGRLAEGEGDMTALLPLAETETVYVEQLGRPISPYEDLQAFWRIYKILRRWRPDIVHTHMAKAGSLGRLAALAYNWRRGRQRRAHLVHTYHGHVFEGYFAAPSTKIFLAIERWLAKRTDALVAISAQVKTDLIQTYRVAREDQVRLIPLGFNLDRLLAIGPDDRRRARASLDIPDHVVVVATVGRLTAIKQHTLFLEAAAGLAAGTGDRFLFLIVGDGELRRSLAAHAEALGVGAHTRFLGWRGDLETIYGATDVFVLTSRNEGTPVALIEAMASGVASVSTDVGGVRDVITGPEVGALAPFGDVKMLVDAVRRFAETPALRKSVGAAARNAVRSRFAVTRLVSDITALYRELLGDRV